MSTHNEQTQIVVASPTPKASDQLAAFLGIEKGMMLETLKAQCFKGKRPDEVSDSQLAAFVSTANVLQVNPLVPGMLYAYPERNGGITPILGPDGVFKKLDEFIAAGKLTGFECDVACDKDGKPVSATATIYRGGDNKAAKYTAYFSEWCVTSNPNWSARPRHMIWVRAIKQAARQVIHGLPMDADEYEISKMQNVTPEPVPSRPPPPPRAAKGAAAVKENAAPKEVIAEVEPAQPEVTTYTKEDQQAAAEVVAAIDKPAPAPATPEKPVESFADAAAATASAGPRTRLNPGEKLTAIVDIAVLKPMRKQGRRKGSDVVEPVPVVYAETTGSDYVGQLVHPEGATEENGEIIALPPWAVGAHLRVELIGGKSPMAVVDKVEVEEVF